MTGWAKTGAGSWPGWIGSAVFVAAAVMPWLGLSTECPAGVTDEHVRRAIERGHEYLIGLQAKDGSFTTSGKTKSRGAGVSSRNGAPYSTLIFMTLGYMGDHPNRPVMEKALKYVMGLDPDEAYGHSLGYALPIRIMGLCYVHDKLAGERQREVRALIQSDIDRLVRGQRPEGGWRYYCDPSRDRDIDFSITQWGVLALREASRIGIEPPTKPLRRCFDLYLACQQKDGGWGYQPPHLYQRAGRRTSVLRPKPYLSMTAAGLASMYILSDILEPIAGCPCIAGRSRRAIDETNRRIDAALEWMVQHYEQKEDAPKGDRFRMFGWRMYALYSVERVGIAAGYKHFGTYDWYRRGAEEILAAQQDHGGWRSIPDTCFALLFLYKGRAPILFNKLQFDGRWNLHRRDIAHLTAYVERVKEQMFHWQIVSLDAPAATWHEAPILYITTEDVPSWDTSVRRKLRAFTDAGGTLLVEASCGNPPVRTWFEEFARETWPEWPLEPLPPTHGAFRALYPLEKVRPDVHGIHDGVRTSVFFVRDDISCAWHVQAVATKEYAFQFGINLYTCATDGAPLRAKLTGQGETDGGMPEALRAPIRAGAAKALRVARVRHGGNWAVGANYRSFRLLASFLKERADVALEVAEPAKSPLTKGGVAPGDLAGYDAAYFAGSRPFELTDEEAQALKAYVAGGGRLWFESVTGSPTFHTSLKAALHDLGCTLRFLPKDDPVLTGRMGSATGFDLTRGVSFRKSLRVMRASRPWAEIMGVYDAAGTLVGLYSPFDVMFALTPHEAHDLHGYEAPWARAVASNIVLYLTTGGDAAGG